MIAGDNIDSRTIGNCLEHSALTEFTEQKQYKNKPKTIRKRKDEDMKNVLTIPAGARSSHLAPRTYSAGSPLRALAQKNDPVAEFIVHNKLRHGF